MTIYAVRNARDPYYSELGLDLLDLLHIAPEDLSTQQVINFAQHNTAMAEWWKLPKGRISPQEAGTPDISVFGGSGLILSPSAHRLLTDSLSPYGELLPVLIEGEKYCLFNCLTFAKEDESNTQFEYDGDQPLWLNHLAFKPDASEKFIFKSKMQKGLTPFCSKRFKDVVESFELKGLWFDEKLIEVF